MRGSEGSSWLGGDPLHHERGLRARGRRGGGRRGRAAPRAAAAPLASPPALIVPREEVERGTEARVVDTGVEAHAVVRQRLGRRGGAQDVGLQQEPLAVGVAAASPISPPIIGRACKARYSAATAERKRRQSSACTRRVFPTAQVRPPPPPPLPPCPSAR